MKVSVHDIASHVGGFPFFVRRLTWKGFFALVLRYDGSLYCVRHYRQLTFHDGRSALYAVKPDFNLWYDDDSLAFLSCPHLNQWELVFDDAPVWISSSVSDDSFSAPKLSYIAMSHNEH